MSQQTDKTLAKVCCFLGVVLGVWMTCIPLVDRNRAEPAGAAERNSRVKHVGIGPPACFWQVFGLLLIAASVAGLWRAERQTASYRRRHVPRTAFTGKFRRQRRRQKKVTVGLCTVGAIVGVAMILVGLACLLLGGTVISSLHGDEDGNHDPSVYRARRAWPRITSGILMVCFGPLLTYGSVKRIRDAERSW